MNLNGNTPSKAKLEIPEAKRTINTQKGRYSSPQLDGEERKVAPSLSNQTEVVSGVEDTVVNMPLSCVTSDLPVEDENNDFAVNEIIPPSLIIQTERNNLITSLKSPRLGLTLTGEVPEFSDEPSAAVSPRHAPLSQASSYINTLQVQTTDDLSLPVDNQRSINNRQDQQQEIYRDLGDSETQSSTQSTSIYDNQKQQCIAVQWNVNGVQERYAELHLLVSEYQPTIIALQETRLTRSQLLDRFCNDEYKWEIRPGPTSSTQNGVGLAVHKSVHHEFLTLNTSLQVVAAHVYHPVRATYASIYIPCHIAVQYLENELDDLIAELPSPVVLLGDFNAHSPYWGSHKYDKKGEIFERFAAQHNLVILNTGEHTRQDPVSGQTSAIDLTMASTELLQQLKWKVDDDNRTSDHFPVILTSSYSRSKHQRRQRWLHEKANWTEFENILLQQIHRGQTYSIDELSKKIVYAAEQSIPRTSGRFRSRAVPWWSSEVSHAVKTRRRNLRKYKRLSDSDPRKEEALRNFQESRNKSRKIIKEAKKASWNNFVSGFNSNVSTSDMWKKMNAFCGRRHNNDVTLVINNETIEAPLEVAERLAEYFETVSEIRPSVNISDEIEYSNTHEDPTEEYNSNFTTEELFWALEKGGNTSVGADNISYAMLRHLPFRIKMQLLDSVNTTWRSGTLPNTWKEGLVVPLPKPGKNPKQLGNQRPITLLSCFSKIVERMVNRRLVETLEKSNRFSEHQYAFRKSRGIESYFAHFEKNIRAPFEEGKHCEILAIDLEKAYDKADRHQILKQTSQLGNKGKHAPFY